MVHWYVECNTYHRLFWINVHICLEVILLKSICILDYLSFNLIHPNHGQALIFEKILLKSLFKVNIKVQRLVHNKYKLQFWLDPETRSTSNYINESLFDMTVSAKSLVLEPD